MRKYMHSDQREGIPGIMDEKVHGHFLDSEATEKETSVTLEQDSKVLLTQKVHVLTTSLSRIPWEHGGQKVHVLSMSNTWDHEEKLHKFAFHRV